MGLLLPGVTSFPNVPLSPLLIAVGLQEPWGWLLSQVGSASAFSLSFRFPLTR